MADTLLRQEPVVAGVARHATVTIAFATPRARFSLRTRTPGDLPATVSTTAPIAGGTALCLGPDEWLAILPDGSAAPALEGVHAVVDVGHRNVAIEVEGPGALAVLQTGCPLDLRAFAVGKATRTLFEQVEIVVWRTADDRFHIETWRSFATYLWATLDLAAGDLR